MLEAVVFSLEERMRLGKVAVGPRFMSLHSSGGVEPETTRSQDSHRKATIARRNHTYPRTYVNHPTTDTHPSHSIQQTSTHSPQCLNLYPSHDLLGHPSTTSTRTPETASGNCRETDRVCMQRQHVAAGG